MSPDRAASSSRGALVAVYGARANVGASSIASALALTLVSLGAGDVAVAELDPRIRRLRAVADQRAAAAILAGSNGQRGEPVHESDRMAIPGLAAALQRRSDAVWTLAPSARPRTSALSDAKSVTLALEAMRTLFRVTVAELEHQVNERTLAALDAADRILVVTESSVPSLRATQRVLRLCHRLKYADEKMAVVVNRFDAPGALALADVSAALKRELYWKIADGSPLDVAGLARKISELL